MQVLVAVQFQTNSKCYLVLTTDVATLRCVLEGDIHAHIYIVCLYCVPQVPGVWDLLQNSAQLPSSDGQGPACSWLDCREVLGNAAEDG